MLTNSDNIEKTDYRQGVSSRTPSANEMIERLAYRQLRTRVKSTLQTGTINHIVAQKISAMISEALSAQLAAERDAALGSRPYERGGVTKRNGYKSKSLPGLWGRLTLRRPVVRAGSLSLPLLVALGITPEGQRHMLGFMLGDKESKAVGLVTRRVDDHLRFFNGPKAFWTLLMTSNLIERRAKRLWKAYKPREREVAAV